MFEAQGAFSREVRKRTLNTECTSLEDRVAWTKEMALALSIEVSELVNETPWKPHRRERVVKQFDRDGLLEEGVDVFNYLLALLDVWNVTGKEFYDIWDDKLRVLNQRRKQEVINPLKAEDTVVMLDLDGCLADFRGGFKNYLQTQRRLDDDFFDPFASYKLDLDWTMSADDYRTLKQNFEDDAGYRSLPVYEGAKALVKAIEAAGHRIVFLTSRKGPKRVYRDSLVWIQENLGPQDFALVMESNKAEWLSACPAKVWRCLEDEPETIKRLLSQGYDVLVPRLPYNKDLKGVSYVDSLLEAAEAFL